ncbi:hypothetical protein ACFQZJ_08400 [Maribacter chungangensis]|uniref:Uncharacterized protein n=1 Tax=Maribacter chungangensis TaxID=1069117 RepID=A0ABW3B2H8_9FLAO
MYGSNPPEASEPFRGSKLVFGELLPEPLILWILFYCLLVFFQCLLVNETFYEASVLVLGTQVLYRSYLALPVLIMLDPVDGLVVNGPKGDQYLAVGADIVVPLRVVLEIYHGVKQVNKVMHLSAMPSTLRPACRQAGVPEIRTKTGAK